MAVSAKRRFKEFTTSFQDDLSFSLLGEEFVCIPELDYRLYRETVGHLANLDDKDDGIENILDNIRQWIRKDEDRERFDALIESDEIIPASLLIDVWRWLMVQYKVIQPDSDPKSK